MCCRSLSGPKPTRSGPFANNNNNYYYYNNNNNNNNNDNNNNNTNSNNNNYNDDDDNDNDNNSNNNIIISRNPFANHTAPSADTPSPQSRCLCGTDDATRRGGSRAGGGGGCVCVLPLVVTRSLAQVTF